MRSTDLKLAKLTASKWLYTPFKTEKCIKSIWRQQTTSRCSCDISIPCTSLMTSYTNCLADSICSLVPSICTVLSVELSPGGKCNGITWRTKTMVTQNSKDRHKVLPLHEKKPYHTWIRAPDFACMFFIDSPPFPITNPTYMMNKWNP